MRATLLVFSVVALGGCAQVGPVGGADLGDDGAAVDLGRVAVPPDLARRPDLHPAGDLTTSTAPDLLTVYAAQPVDLGPSADDLAPVAPAPDLLDAMDLTPAAPDLDNGCRCTGGARCLVTGDTCGEQRVEICAVPQNCGGAGLPPCDTAGLPDHAGRCILGLRPFGGTCFACAPAAP